MTDNYSHRREEEIEVKTVSYHDDGYVQIDTTRSTGFVIAVHPGMEELLVGEALVLETRNFSTITGLKRPERDWFFRKTDADLEEDHAQMVAGFRRRHEELLEKNREDWAAREAALPEDLRARLEFFRSKGGHEFEVEGWGYELIICELAELYRRTGWRDVEDGDILDSEEIEEYAAKHGTSGNQHGIAKLLVQALAEGIQPAEVPGGMTPLGMSKDYGPRE
jgi:DNA-binding transcriptional ArsR family regulator